MPAETRERKPMQERVDPTLAAGNRVALAGYATEHFAWQVE